MNALPTTCARCGQPAEGLATIDDVHYCHDGDDPTCYQLASMERHADEGIPLLDNPASPARR
jgi:hypothetical protein